MLCCWRAARPPTGNIQTAYNIAPAGRRRLRRRRRHQPQKLWRPRRLHHADLDRRHAARCRSNRPRRRDRACSTAMRAAGDRCRSRPRAIIGPGARRRRPGGCADATSYFERAAATPELFYGQLALERLGRTVPRPPAHADAAGHRRPAQRIPAEAAGPRGPAAWPAGPAAPSRSLFVRALSEDVDSDAERVLAIELATPDRAAGPCRVDRAVGAQQRHGLLHKRRLSRPILAACRRAASGRWSTASPARKAVRPRRGQPRRRARDDAVDARHRARAGGQDGRRLRLWPADHAIPATTSCSAALISSGWSASGTAIIRWQWPATMPARATSANGSTPMATRAARRRHDRLDREHPVRRDPRLCPARARE